VPVSAGRPGNPADVLGRITGMTRYTAILAVALCALAPFLLAACGGGGGY
jgi:hypothetical protein